LSLGRAGGDRFSCKKEPPCYGFAPLVTHAPAPHFRFGEVVTTVVALFGATTVGLCFAAPAAGPTVPLPIELPVTAPPAEAGFVTPPSAAGFVAAEAEMAVPPMAGAGFEAPPIALCFVLAGPPSAFWAAEGHATVSASVPTDTTRTIILIMVLFFMDAILPVAGRISALCLRSLAVPGVRISLYQPIEI
jgi:hypothetical protein